MHPAKKLVLLIGLSIAVSGCAAVIVGGAAAGGTYAYLKGEMQTAYPHGVKTVFNAAVAALQDDMGIAVQDKTCDLTDGLINAVRADGNKVKVRLKLVGADVTEVRVRVGTIGDKTWSQLYLDKLTKRL